MSDLEVLSYAAIRDKCEKAEQSLHDTFGEPLETYLRTCPSSDVRRIERALERRKQEDEYRSEQIREEAIAAGIVLSGCEVFDCEDGPYTTSPLDTCTWLRKHRPDVVYVRHGNRIYFAPSDQFLCFIHAVERYKRKRDEQQRHAATVGGA